MSDRIFAIGFALFCILFTVCSMGFIGLALFYVPMGVFARGIFLIEGVLLLFVARHAYMLARSAFNGH